ncbi:conserved protein of unknown function [Rhodovastum atsumiense]|uniref:Uncharacterized protein n=1 Tax=Rhodovastum atsumiense TaxID=504468 RepID=A0A5M6IXU6_9PROT|nr:hypothetical protein [Rhodovastum atsumiense]KAA5612175.1 hypothetical protein F1189_10960 [Rhodovastum atsumiense]CAH2603872.1 conserved protein of unknown function [Rhodovastum atsumiense]
MSDIVNWRTLDRTLDRAMPAAAPRQVLTALLLATALAAPFGSRALLDWTERQPDSPAMMILHDGALAWDAAMTRLGLADAYGAVRQGMRNLQAARFASPGQP